MGISVLKGRGRDRERRGRKKDFLFLPDPFFTHDVLSKNEKKKKGNLVSEPFCNYHKHGEPYPVGVKSFRLFIFTIFFSFF